MNSLIRALLSGIYQDDNRASTDYGNGRLLDTGEENLYPEYLFIAGRINLFPVYNGKSPMSSSCCQVDGPPREWCHARSSTLVSAIDRLVILQ